MSFSRVLLLRKITQVRMYWIFMLFVLDWIWRVERGGCYDLNHKKSLSRRIYHKLVLTESWIVGSNEWKEEENIK